MDILFNHDSYNKYNYVERALKGSKNQDNWTNIKLILELLLEGVCFATVWVPHRCNHGLGIWVGTVTKEQGVSCFGWLRLGCNSQKHDAEVTRSLGP